MFERFTDRARRTLVLAQEEARLLGHNFIGTEHLLLGLVHEGDGVAAIALGALGVRFDVVRGEVARTVGSSAQPSTGSPPFTPRAKKVLELSLREALQLGHNYIGTEHMLLGLIREGDGVGIQVLETLGIDLSQVRHQVIALLNGQPPPAPVEAMDVNLGANREGPRCPTCRSLLDGHVGYRVLPVIPTEPSEDSESVDVMFVYCLRCGVLLAHISTSDIGFGSGAGSRAVAFARVEPTATAGTPERVIAEGVAENHVSWTLRVGGVDESYGTMLRTEDSQGVIDHGGMGGPKLWGTDLMNVYTGINSDRGPLGIVVRCDPSIEHLTVVSEDGTEHDMVDCGEADGLRFSVLLVEPNARLREVVGTNRDRTVIERYELHHHDTSRHRHHPE